jgi:hypothetical protein
MKYKMQIKEKNQGIIAGVLLVIMAVVAGFSFGYAHAILVVESPEITLRNLMADKLLFYAELVGWSIIFIADLIVALALYFFFRNASRQISLITASARIVYTIILGFAILQLFKIIPVLSLSNPLSDELIVSSTESQIQLFEKLWSVGLIIFGLHLIGLGYLSVKSKSVHRLIGYLLYFAGVCYVFIHAIRQLNLPDLKGLNLLENILILPMALAEILLAFWLIFNGFRKTSKDVLS